MCIVFKAIMLLILCTCFQCRDGPSKHSKKCQNSSILEVSAGPRIILEDLDAEQKSSFRTSDRSTYLRTEDDEPITKFAIFVRCIITPSNGVKWTRHALLAGTGAHTFSNQSS